MKAVPWAGAPGPAWIVAPLADWRSPTGHPAEQVPLRLPGTSRPGLPRAGACRSTRATSLYLLAEPERLEAMREQAARVGPPRAAPDVAEGMLAEFHSGAHA